MGREAGEVLEYVSRIEGENLEDYIEDVSQSLDRALEFFEEGMAGMLDVETTASMSAEDVLEAGGMSRGESNDLRAEYDGEIFVGNDVIPADPAPYERLQEAIKTADLPAAIVESIEEEIEKEEKRLEKMERLEQEKDQIREWVENIKGKESTGLDLLEEPLVYIQDFSDDLIDEGVYGGYEVLESRRVIGNPVAMIVENYFMPDEEYLGEVEIVETEEAQVPQLED